MVFEQSLDALLPFVPVLKNGGDARIVRQALNQLRQNEQIVELESLLGFFASFVLNTEIVRQILRWDMAILQESPWYQEILREGGCSPVLKQLTRRFGVLPPNVLSKFRNFLLTNWIIWQRHCWIFQK